MTTRLDTHVVVWLYIGEVDRLGPAVRDALEHDTLAISPVVELELTFLHEMGRLVTKDQPIHDHLRLARW